MGRVKQTTQCNPDKRGQPELSDYQRAKQRVVSAYDLSSAAKQARKNSDLAAARSVSGAPDLKQPCIFSFPALLLALFTMCVHGMQGRTVCDPQSLGAELLDANMLTVSTNR
jgi:hypothetical protein